MKNHGSSSIALARTRQAVTAGGQDPHALSIAAPGGSLDANVTPGGAGAGARESGRRIGRGFRYLFGEPKVDEVFRYMGMPVDHAPELGKRLRVTLMKLAYALEGPKANARPPSHGAPYEDHDPRDNPDIPAGYTYLMQLIAHDIVQSASSLAQTNERSIALLNMRSTMLRLESIYGGGPEASPLLYESRTAGANAPSSYLRLGPLDTANAPTCPFRDLARVDLTAATQDVRRRVESPPPGPGGIIAPTTDAPAQARGLVSLPDVLVGDSRNDDNAILSQLTVVFHLLHNGLVKRSEGVPSKSRSEGATRLFHFARLATTLIFRNVLRRDVMSRLLHPEIYRLYDGESPPNAFAFDGKVPLEFTHGAMRVCHTMLRRQYVLNERFSFSLLEVLTENSANSSVSMPLPRSWAIAWSNFFPGFDRVDRAPVNLSARLRPRYDPQTQSAELFDQFDETKKPGLAYRDMLSSVLAGMWSVPAMIARLATDTAEPRLAEVFRGSKLTNRAAREEAVRTWLAANCLAGDLEMQPNELDALAQDPPLPFYLMLEAMVEPDCSGRRLGPLGSVIVAAVVYGILKADPIVPHLASLTDQLRYLHESVLGQPLGEHSFDGLDSMADLIQFVSDLHELEEVEPPFI